MKKYIYEILVLVRDFFRQPVKIIVTRNKIESIMSRENPKFFFGEKRKELDLKYWKKCVKRFAIANPENAYIIANQLVNAPLEYRKNVFGKREGVIYVCIVKNDLDRAKKSLDYYKKLGVRNFVFIDNNSDDGTYEWIMNQEVDVFWTNAKFSSSAKTAWLTYIFEYYGYDRWYLIVDIDELLSYPQCEKHSINDLIVYMEKNKKKRLLSFMLDMYIDGKLSEIDNAKDWNFEDYCYYDTNSYTMTKNLHYYKITGGPRQRVFKHDSKGTEMIQNKYPLVYISKGELYRYHYVFPFYNNFDMKCMAVLKHYKFMPGDLKKYEKIVKEGTYANGSQLYKDSLKMIKENKNLNFWNQESCKYYSSDDLLKIDLVNEITWENKKNI